MPVIETATSDYNFGKNSCLVVIILEFCSGESDLLWCTAAARELALVLIRWEAGPALLDTVLVWLEFENIFMCHLWDKIMDDKLMYIVHPPLD